jgi:hypothetical protein
MAKFKAKPFKRYLDEIVRRLVPFRDGCCQRCGGGIDETHHIWQRQYNHVRWYLPNLVSLCKSPCHQWYHNEIGGECWFKETFPDRWQMLLDKPRHQGTWKELDFREAEDYLAREAIKLGYDGYNMKAYKSRFKAKLKEMT